MSPIAGRDSLIAFPQTNLFVRNKKLISTIPLFAPDNLSQSQLYNTISWDLAVESCIDCRARYGTCSIHSVWWWLVTAWDIVVAAKRAQSNKERKINPMDAEGYNAMIHKEYRSFYQKNFWRTHTHDSSLMLDKNLLLKNWTSKNDIKLHLDETISCGALWKVLLDAFELADYGLKYHEPDLPILIDMYNHSISEGCYDTIENTPQKAKQICLQYSPEIHETLFDANSAKRVIGELNGTRHSSVINTMIDDHSAFVYDYDASYLNALQHISLFIAHLKSQKNNEYDNLVVKICKLFDDNDWEDDRDKLYEFYETILVGKFKKQRIRSDMTIVRNIPNAAQIMAQNNQISPTLIWFNLSSNHNN